MGLKLLDYFFKSDPFEFNFRLLVLNGFWPVDTTNRYLQAFYSVYSFLCVFSPVSMLFIQILEIYLNRNDSITLSKNMCATSVTIACVVKYILIFFKVDEVNALHRELIAFKSSRTDPDEVEILRNAKEFMAQTTKAVYRLAIPCIAAWMLYPGLESSEKKSVPFPYRLPTDDWSTPVYEILYTYQSLSMVGFMVMILSNDLIYYGMVISINAEYNILIRKMKRLKLLHTNPSGDDSEGTKARPNAMIVERLKSDFKDCIVFHQKILQKIDQLKMIYGMPYLVHLLSAVTLMGVIIIDIVVVSKGFKLQMLQRVIYTANGVFDTFLSCYFTTKLEEMSYELMRAVYSSEWYMWGPEVRKDLLFMSMRSRKAPSIKVANHFALNLETFLQFLKISYNIAALLYQTVRD